MCEHIWIGGKHLSHTKQENEHTIFNRYIDHSYRGTSGLPVFDYFRSFVLTLQGILPSTSPVRLSSRAAPQELI
jgi:hypothetical protein